VRAAAFVVVEADFSRDWLCRRVPGFDTKIHRIYNGMDLSSFPAAVPNPGKPRIVSVGRCIEKKGFDDLIDACVILRKKDLEFECVIIGGGLQDCVTLTGPRPQEEVRRQLASATLFVLPCVTEPGGGMDTLPTVIVEAMAAGLPVISTRLAAIPEMVENGITGLLVGEKQPGPLAEALAEILRNPDLANRFGRAGKQAAAGRFAAESTVASLRTLLEQSTGP
jgi:glycosyltransferase involved in cell wall biosynthesis